MKKVVILFCCYSTILFANVMEDANNICSTILNTSIANECTIKEKSINISINSFFYTDSLCNKFSKLVSLNTSEFNGKKWKLILTYNNSYSICDLY